MGFTATHVLSAKTAAVVLQARKQTGKTPILAIGISWLDVDCLLGSPTCGMTFQRIIDIESENEHPQDEQPIQPQSLDYDLGLEWSIEEPGQELARYCRVRIISTFGHLRRSMSFNHDQRSKAMNDWLVQPEHQDPWFLKAHNARQLTIRGRPTVSTMRFNISYECERRYYEMIRYETTAILRSHIVGISRDFVFQAEIWKKKVPVRSFRKVGRT